MRLTKWERKRGREIEIKKEMEQDRKRENKERNTWWEKEKQWETRYKKEMGKDSREESEKEREGEREIIFREQEKIKKW